MLCANSLRVATSILAWPLQCKLAHAGVGCEKEWSLCMGGIHLNPGCTPSAHFGRRTAWGKHAQDFTVQNTHTYCWLAGTGNPSCMNSPDRTSGLPGYCCTSLLIGCSDLFSCVAPRKRELPNICQTPPTLHAACCRVIFLHYVVWTNDIQASSALCALPEMPPSLCF